MGATRQSRKRTERGAGEPKKRGTRLLEIIAAISVAVIVLVPAISLSGLFNRILPAVTIGGTGFSLSNANFFYHSVYNNFYNTNADYISSYLDPNLPLTEQQCFMDYNLTWAEYFWNSAFDQMKEIAAATQAAEAAGFTLGEEDLATIDSSIAALDASAVQAGTTLNGYLPLVFGAGNNEKTVRAMLEKSQIAYLYLTEQLDGYTYTEDELAQYYAENSETFDTVTYMYTWISGAPPAADAAADIPDANADAADAAADTDANADVSVSADAADSADSTGADTSAGTDAAGEGGSEAEGNEADAAANAPDTEATEAAEAAAMAEALAKAQQIVTASSRDEFSQLVQAQTGGAPSTATTALANLSADYSAWLTDNAREEGDTAYVEGSGGYYALYFINSSDNHYNTVSVRHILVMAEDGDSDGMYSAAELDAARAEIDAISAEWEEAGGTEDAFAELAVQKSEDGGSAQAGGLYEGVYKNQMVEEFDRFCFEPHSPGDTAVVFGSNQAYAGYHLIYYVGEGEAYWKTLAENARRTADYEAWELTLLSPYEIKQNFLMRYAEDW